MPSRRYERDHVAMFPDTRPGGGFDNAVKEALRRPLNKVFGTPEAPTRLGRFMNGLEEGAALSMMAYGGAAGRVGNLRRFTQLSRRPGVQPSTLKKWTNIERGVYGLGVETKGDAYLRPASVYGGINNRPLAQMAWVHPDVLKVHPKMGEVPVAIVPDAAWVSTVERARRGMTSWSRDGSTADGFSMSGGRGIAIRGVRPGEDIIAFNERADRTLVHEMQHVSQDFDGIRPARGHASYNEYRTDGREVDARNTANRNHLTPQERTEMPRSMTQDVKADLVQLDDKGGDNFGTFRNFLATDEVPDSLFGYPIAHDENDYTEKDIQFFKENPKAAGFYDLGDEEIEEDVPQQAAKAKPSRGTYPGSLNNPGNVEKRKERRQGEVDSPHERWAKFATPQDGLREMADAIRQIATVKLVEKGQPFTLRNFAEVYAPRVNEKGEPENDTDKYIADISADSGFDPDTVLHRFDGDDMARLLRSIVRFESGAPHSAWFTNEEYLDAAKKLQEGAVD